MSSERHRTPIFFVRHTLHTWDRTAAEKRQQCPPVERWAVVQAQRNLLGVASLGPLTVVPSERRGRFAKTRLEQRIEAAHARETGCERDLSQRQAGLLQQVFRQGESLRLRELHWC